MLTTMVTKDSMKSRRDEYTEATRFALMAAGRETFAREGYQSASVEVISRTARVTRGAFYHHFEDKQALFDAIVVAMQSKAASTVEKCARQHPKIWDRLSTGIDAYLDVCLEPDYARIVVREAPVVLGQSRFQEIEEKYPQALLKATLAALKQQGELDFGDINLLSHLVDALICKIAVLLPETADPAALRADGNRVLDGLLDGLRRNGKLGTAAIAAKS